MKSWLKYVIALLLVCAMYIADYIIHEKYLGQDDFNVGWLLVYVANLIVAAFFIIFIFGLAKRTSFLYLFASFLGISFLIITPELYVMGKGKHNEDIFINLIYFGMGVIMFLRYRKAAKKLVVKPTEEKPA